MVRPVAVFLLGTFGIACAAIFVRFALPAPPVVTAFWRIALAVALLGLYLAARGGGLRLPPRVLGPALLAGACYGLDMALWNTALVATSVADATFLVNTTPVWIALHAAVWLREPPGTRFLAGGALALAGTALLLGDDLGREASLRGDLLALGAAVFYSAYLLLVKRVRRELDAAAAVFVAGVAAAATLAVVAALRGDAFLGHPARSWASFAALALVSHLGGVLGIVWALRHLRATFAAVALLAQPVGTALLGLVFLGETLSLLQLLGGTAVAAGIALAARAGTGNLPAPADAAATSRSGAPPTRGRSPEGRGPRSS